LRLFKALARDKIANKAADLATCHAGEVTTAVHCICHTLRNDKTTTTARLLSIQFDCGFAHFACLLAASQRLVTQRLTLFVAGPGEQWRILMDDAQRQPTDL
jgi:hypothetical protein